VRSCAGVLWGEAIAFKQRIIEGSPGESAKKKGAKYRLAKIFGHSQEEGNERGKKASILGLVGEAPGKRARRKGQQH